MIIQLLNVGEVHTTKVLQLMDLKICNSSTGAYLHISWMTLNLLTWSDDVTLVISSTYKTNGVTYLNMKTRVIVYRKYAIFYVSRCNYTYIPMHCIRLAISLANWQSLVILWIPSQ